MWYSGHDGTTGRILAAVQPPGGPWERLGVAIDAGFAGDSDEYGVESPCVVPTPGGYLMTYAGFDGEVTRLHMATSEEGRSWTAQGTIMQRGPMRPLAPATHAWSTPRQAGGCSSAAMTARITAAARRSWRPSPRPAPPGIESEWSWNP